MGAGIKRCVINHPAWVPFSGNQEKGNFWATFVLMFVVFGGMTLLDNKNKKDPIWGHEGVVDAASILTLLMIPTIIAGIHYAIQNCRAGKAQTNASINATHASLDASDSTEDLRKTTVKTWLFSAAGLFLLGTFFQAYYPVKDSSCHPNNGTAFLQNGTCPDQQWLITTEVFGWLAQHQMVIQASACTAIASLVAAANGLFNNGFAGKFCPASCTSSSVRGGYQSV